MKVEIIRNIKQISADDGMFLCNEESKDFKHKVCVGVNADETKWQEITAEEKARLEAEWGIETEPTETEATETDYINALEDLGVNFNG